MNLDHVTDSDPNTSSWNPDSGGDAARGPAGSATPQDRQTGSGPYPPPGHHPAARHPYAGAYGSGYGSGYSTGHGGVTGSGAASSYGTEHAGQQPAGQYLQPGHAAYPPPYAAYPPAGYPAHLGYVPPTPPRRSRRARTLWGAGALGLAAALVVAGVGVGRATDTTSGSGTVAQGSSNSAGTGSGSSGSTGSSGSGGSSSGQFPGLGGGSGGGTGSGSTSGSSGASGTAADSTQQIGIVTVDSTLGYEDAESAGTGLIVTSNGEIVTNNHVVDGATKISVTVESTGKTYSASVVGTDATDDVAVLQLSNASGLTTAKIAGSSAVSTLAVGDSITGVGNGGGTGTLNQASGTVTALDQSITATDNTGADAETLHGLIETNADIVPGDSGGPLYNSQGKIVGIDTAASTSNSARTTSDTTTAGYAIPITTVLSIAKTIESGTSSSTIHQGLPAFLGVSVAESSSGGAAISSVLSGGPADDAGITAGSVITAVGGKAVSSAATLKSDLAAYQPGQKVSVTWTDSSGQQHTATVTLTTGPAD